MCRYFKVFSITQYLEYVSEWKSKGLSNESIKAISTSDTKIRVEFTGGCLKQPKISYTHRKVVNIYIVYELGASSSNDSDPTLKDCLFGALTLTKDADIEKYGYSGYEIGFDRRGSFSKCINFWRRYEFFCTHGEKDKRHISLRNRTNTKIRTYINRR